MKIKNVNLQWFVIYKDFNSDEINKMNVLGGNFAEELAKKIKSKSKYRPVYDKATLKEYLRGKFMYHYWCKSEFEILVGGFFTKNEDFKKIDIWYQLEPNLDTIVEYINYKMELDFQ